MILNKTVDKLKARPRHERRDVAGSAAMLIVAILLVGWAILFFKKIKRTDLQAESAAGSLQGSFDLSQITETQRQIVEGYDNALPSK